MHTLLRLPTGHLLRAGREGERPLLRPQAGVGDAVDAELWVYDLRTNQHFTLKQNPLRREHLEDFVDALQPDDRHEREASRAVPALHVRRADRSATRSSLDIFWLRDESLEDIGQPAAARGDRRRRSSRTSKRRSPSSLRWPRLSPPATPSRSSGDTLNGHGTGWARGGCSCSGARARRGCRVVRPPARHGRTGRRRRGRHELPHEVRSPRLPRRRRFPKASTST